MHKAAGHMQEFFTNRAETLFSHMVSLSDPILTKGAFKSL